MVMTRLPVLGELRMFSCSFTTAIFSLGALVGTVVGAVVGTVEGSVSTMLGISELGSVGSVEGSVDPEPGSREQPLSIPTIKNMATARLRKRQRDDFFLKG